MRRFTVVLSAVVVALVPVVTMSPAEAAPYRVTASISTSSAQSGQGPVIKGSLSPATPGKTVYVQRYIGGTWTTIDTSTTDADGRYVERVSPTELGYQVGSMTFRAKVIGSGSTSSGASSPVTKTIYGWQPLAYMTAIYGNGRRFFDGEGEFQVDDVYTDEGWHILDPLIGQISDRYTKWNLEEKCIHLRGFAGIDNGSAVGAQGRLVISLDGTSHDYARTFDRNELAILDKPLYKTHYMAFKGYRLNSNATVVGVGRPAVLCSKIFPTS